MGTLPSICEIIGSDGYAYPVVVRLLDRMGTPTQNLCDYWSGWYLDVLVYVWIWTPVWAIGVVRDLGFSCDLGHYSRLFEGVTDWIYVRGVVLLLAFVYSWFGVLVMPVIEMRNDQGMVANGDVEGVNGNVEGANRGAPDFSTMIAQQLQNLLPAMLAQVGNQGNVENQNGNVVNENVQENVGNAIVNGNHVGCSYKEFLARNYKEYNGKGGAVVLTRWIEKIESNHAMVGAGHAAYTDRFHELARLVPHLVTPESRMIERYVYGLASQIRRMVAATKPKPIHKAVQISGALTDEAVRNGSIKKVEKRGNVGNLERIRMDCKGMPRNVNPINVRNPIVRACYECGSTDHVRSACPRLNRAQGPEGNHPNQVAANNGSQGRGNQGNQARGRAFTLGSKEARQDLNIMTGIKLSELGFRYEIEIASGQLVEIDKVIKSCKLEIGGHVFDINLIPFGHGSFDVIIDSTFLVDSISSAWHVPKPTKNSISMVLMKQHLLIM
nr:hypothetical protein [Tanacetum cinerariifolium]GEZ11048.1 hypothetical protein [Tanacetum cinerariifolium]